jgi:hypothetical protein
MPGEVELRNEYPPVFELVQLEGERNRVLVETGLEVLVPLAADIVRDEDSGDPGLQRGDQR